nr:MAG TPA: hypothetical protein [Caudoviricetes sp.]
MSFYIELDSLKPDHFGATKVYYYYYIRQKDKYYVLKKSYSDNLNNVPFIVNEKTKLSDVIENADFEGSNSIVIYPTI